ncbi:hypothetical protein [Curtobacterium sp. RRHDQ10]|uniref:hypothetical protein n=1 Tax=Curtobacterium phyllosphaerae TaxID=3413379 RepID=UPI003BF28999
MTASTQRAVLRAALQASWRVMISVFVLAGMPLLGLAAAFGDLDDGTVRVRLVAYAVVLPLSLFLHELGHGVAYAALVARHGMRPVELFGVGRWSGGTIVRWRLSLGEDAIVAVAGPLLGVACVLPMLAPGGPFLVGFPVALVFGLHLASLRRTADDGAQARAVWRGADERARAA